MKRAIYLLPLRRSDGGDVVTLVPLDMDALYPHLPEVVEYDDEGEVVGTSPAERRLPHGWGGWPAVG